jgi:hypothetical protein
MDGVLACAAAYLEHDTALRERLRENAEYRALVALASFRQ